MSRVRQSLPFRRAATAAVSLGLLAAACSGVVATTTSARDLARAQQELRRGSATKGDVTRLLGVPDGRGEALLPGQEGGPREVWVYQTLRAGPIGQPAARAQMQAVMVFFDADRFDGMMGWSSDDKLVIRSTEDAGSVR